MATKSRPTRWAEAVAKAQDALGELQDIQSEYQDWLDNLPENLQSGSLADKLNEVVGLDIEGTISTLSDAQGVDLPLGFGRD